MNYIIYLLLHVTLLMYIHRSKIDNYTFNLKADFNEPLVLEGMYNIQGKIIILPIMGEGRSNLTLGINAHCVRIICCI